VLKSACGDHHGKTEGRDYRCQRHFYQRAVQGGTLSGRVEQTARNLQADKITLLLNDDNMLEKVLASGNVHIEDTTAKGSMSRPRRAK